MAKIMKENKFLYLVNFIACMLVIVIHTRFPGNFGTAMDAVSRIAVPYFFALSGRFLLRDGDEDTDKIMERLHQVPMGDKLVELLEVMKDCLCRLFCFFSFDPYLSWRFDQGVAYIQIFSEGSALVCTF